MATADALPLDHTVINVRFDMDRAHAIFESLGFFLTPRGHHSLGSINHLIVLEDDYVELVGLPLNTTVLRQDVLDSPVGIDGLVFQTQSADKTYNALKKAKRTVQPVQAFSRPVTVKNKVLEACFRTTRFAPGTYPAGRVYFCQHLTPELVWRQEWQSHPNHVIRTAAFLIVSNVPEQEAKKYCQASGGHVRLGMNGEFRIQAQNYDLVFVTPAQYRQCFGALAVSVQTAGHSDETEGSRTSFFGAIALHTTDLDSVRKRLVRTKKKFPEIVWTHADARISVSIPYYNAVIDFVQYS